MTETLLAEQKQDPIPVIYTEYPFAKCPICGGEIIEGGKGWEKENCLICGQALKWKKEGWL